MIILEPLYSAKMTEMNLQYIIPVLKGVLFRIFLSPPVLMHGGLICIALRLSVTKIHTRS